MFPSRGLVPTGHALRLRQLASSHSQVGCARQFGTALRRTGGSRLAGRVAPSPALSMGALGSRRAGLPQSLSATTTTLSSTIPASAAAFSLWPSSISSSVSSLWSGKSTPPAEAADPASAAAAAASAPTPEVVPPPLDAATAALASPPAADPVVSATSSDSAAALSEILDGGALLDMPEQIGYLSALGLDFGWGPTSMCQWAVEHLHVWGGLPWWAAIAVTALVFRAAIFFPSLTAAEQSAKFQLLRQDPQFADAMKQMQEAALRGGPQGQSKAMEMRMRTKRMRQQAGVSSWKMFIPMVNVPFGYGMFRLLRSMAILPVPGFDHAGLLWITDLTVPDPYFILPITSATIMYLIFRSNIAYMAPEQAQMMKMMQIVITPISILVTVRMSAALTLFFFVSSLLQMVQTWLWHQPWLRVWKGLPPMHTLVKTSPASLAAQQQRTAFRLSPGSTWQAPRAISTSADAAAAAAAATPSTVDVVKKGWDKMIGNAKEKQGATKDKQVLKKADDYEKKRALEDEENLYRRREAERRYREMKKAIARGQKDRQQS